MPQPRVSGASSTGASQATANALRSASAAAPGGDAASAAVVLPCQREQALVSCKYVLVVDALPAGLSDGLAASAASLRQQVVQAKEQDKAERKQKRAQGLDLLNRELAANPSKLTGADAIEEMKRSYAAAEHERRAQKDFDDKTSRHNNEKKEYENKQAEYRAKKERGEPLTAREAHKLTTPFKGQIHRKPAWEALSAEDREKKTAAAQAHINHLIYDEIIEGYEEDYHASRASRQGMKDRLLANLKPGYMVDSGDRIEIYATHDTPAGDQEEARVATVLFGARRFARTPESTVNPVFTHLGSQREYVQDENGVFVRRYLVRSLAAGEEPAQGLVPRKGGPKKRLPMPPDRKEAVQKHLREAQQYESPFISASSTRAPILGSTGANFYNPTNGRVVLDAAQIPRNKLVDVHTPEAVGNILGKDKVTFGKRFNPDAPAAEMIDYEKNAAARDTLRTREVLVEDGVPRYAIVAVEKGNIGWTDLHGRPLTQSARDRFEVPR